MLASPDNVPTPKVGKTVPEVVEIHLKLSHCESLAFKLIQAVSGFFSLLEFIELRLSYSDYVFASKIGV